MASSKDQEARKQRGERGRLRRGRTSRTSRAPAERVDAPGPPAGEPAGEAAGEDELPVEPPKFREEAAQQGLPREGLAPPHADEVAPEPGKFREEALREAHDAPLPPPLEVEPEYFLKEELLGEYEDLDERAEEEDRLREERSDEEDRYRPEPEPRAADEGRDRP